MSAASVALVCFAGRARPDDPVLLADFLTSVADLRAAVCLESGTDPADITSLGYDHSARGYASVRASWVNHVAQWGIAMFDRNLEKVRDIWLDMAEGDDWRAEGERLHRERYPDGCQEGGHDACTRTCEVCYPVPAEWL